LLKADAKDLEARDRKIMVRDEPARNVSIAKTVRIALSQGKSISGEGAYWPKVDPNREWVENPYGQLSEAFSFGTTIVEVQVDPETGQVTVLETWAAQDVGRALNPAIVESQFEGSLAMGGQGGMLTEYHLFDRGRVLNPTQLDYKLPLACDMPKMNNIIIETHDPHGPYGAKEAAMSIAMSAAQGYSAAICNAIGVYIHEFPITPDKILKALEEKQARGTRIKVEGET
jgi:CO/xanthine dehydrogenase Mo-binding subunit